MALSLEVLTNLVQSAETIVRMLPASPNPGGHDDLRSILSFGDAEKARKALEVLACSIEQLKATSISFGTHRE